MTDKTRTYRGMLVRTGNGEESDLVGYVGEDHRVRILAEEVNSDNYNPTNRGGRMPVSIRYFITDQPVESSDLEVALAATFDYDIDYCMHYSELTGYLWTDENLKVGGHNLIKILSNYLGKYLHLEVTFHAS